MLPKRGWTSMFGSQRSPCKLWAAFGRALRTGFEVLPFRSIRNTIYVVPLETVSYLRMEQNVVYTNGLKIPVLHFVTVSRLQCRLLL